MTRRPEGARASSRAITHFVDAIRVCIASGPVLSQEISDQTDALETMRGDAENRTQVVRLLLALWSVVDTAHRLRQLIEQAPYLKKKIPEVQLFLRGNSGVEALRNYAQHLRREIPNLPAGSTPIWGAVSWVSRSDPTRCLTLFAASHHPEISTYTLTYDRLEKRFTSQLILSVNNITIEPFRILTRISGLSNVVETWANTNGLKGAAPVVPLFEFRVPEAGEG